MTKLIGQGGSEFANKTQNIELAAQYNFDVGIVPTIEYLQSKAMDTTYGDFYQKKDLALGLEYVPVRDLRFYVAYNFNLLNENDRTVKQRSIDTDNTAGVGVKYKF